MCLYIDSILQCTKLFYRTVIIIFYLKTVATAMVTKIPAMADAIGSMEKKVRKCKWADKLRLNFTHKHTHARTHAHSHARTHTHTHTHTEPALSAKYGNVLHGRRLSA